MNLSNPSYSFHDLHDALSDVTNQNVTFKEVIKKRLKKVEMRTIKKCGETTIIRTISVKFRQRRIITERKDRIKANEHALVEVVKRQ